MSAPPRGWEAVPSSRSPARPRAGGSGTEKEAHLPQVHLPRRGPGPAAGHVLVRGGLGGGPGRGLRAGSAAGVEMPRVPWIFSRFCKKGEDLRLAPGPSPNGQRAGSGLVGGSLATPALRCARRWKPQGRAVVVRLVHFNIPLPAQGGCGGPGPLMEREACRQPGTLPSPWSPEAVAGPAASGRGTAGSQLAWGFSWVLEALELGVVHGVPAAWPSHLSHLPFRLGAPVSRRRWGGSESAGFTPSIRHGLPGPAQRCIGLGAGGAAGTGDVGGGGSAGVPGHPCCARRSSASSSCSCTARGSGAG